jgi:hypothetical protein
LATNTVYPFYFKFYNYSENKSWEKSMKSFVFANLKISMYFSLKNEETAWGTFSYNSLQTRWVHLSSWNCTSLDTIKVSRTISCTLKLQGVHQKFQYKKSREILNCVYFIIFNYMLVMFLTHAQSFLYFPCFHVQHFMLF